MQYLDFFAFSPGAVIVLINIVMERWACVPNAFALDQLSGAPSYPGMRRLACLSGYSQQCPALASSCILCGL